MLLTLLRALNTTDLLEVVQNLSMAPLDIDLLLYDAAEAGEISIDKKKGKIKALKEPDTLYYDPDLWHKLRKIIQRYDEQGANITYNRLKEVTLGLGSMYGYPAHDFACTLYKLVEEDGVHKYEINVPAVKKKRPANKFVFYTFLDHQEFGAKAVNDFIDQMDKISVS